MTGKRQVTIVPDPDALARCAAELFHTTALTALRRSGRFTVALSGGTTPYRFYSLLGAAQYSSDIAWERVHAFWADERCVPPDHHDSNFHEASLSFLSRVALPETNIHRIKGEAGADSAALLYELDLHAFFRQTAYPRFDLIFLGIGADGHTASLFPGDPAVSERMRLAAPVRRTPPDHDRVTLTLPVLAHAGEIVVLVSGTAKAAIAREILDGGNPRQCPAGLVAAERGSVLWMLDRDAASGLAAGGRG